MVAAGIPDVSAPVNISRYRRIVKVTVGAALIPWGTTKKFGSTLTTDGTGLSNVLSISASVTVTCAPPSLLNCFIGEVIVLIT